MRARTNLAESVTVAKESSIAIVRRTCVLLTCIGEQLAITPLFSNADCNRLRALGSRDRGAILTVGIACLRAT